jgi:hypothetical protein
MPGLNAAVGNWPTPEAARWATPTTQDAANTAGPSQWLRHTPPLNVQASWPTPKASAENYGQPRENDRGDLQAAALLSGRETWPTPSATPYGSSQNWINGKGGEFERPSAGTPSLERMARGWPTPQARDEKGPTGASGRPEEGGRRSSLSDTAMPGATGGRLNPRWVAVLMGFPEDWFDGLPAPAKRSTRGSRPASSPAPARTGRRSSGR